MTEHQFDLSAAIATFIDEANDLLAQMEEILLTAEAGGSGTIDMNALFRCAHTIKGSAGLFEFNEIVGFTHVVENLLDALRKGHLSFSPALISDLLECRDHIAGLIAVISGADPQDCTRSDALIRKLQRWQSGESALVASAQAPLNPQSPVEVATRDDAQQGDDLWLISLRFNPGVLCDGLDPLGFIHYLSNYGKLVQVDVVADALPAFEDADPEQCYLGFDVALSSTASKEELESSFDFIRDNARIVILPPRNQTPAYLSLIADLPEERQRIGEILVACGALTRNELDEALAFQSAHAQSAPIGEILVETGRVPGQVVEAAATRQRQVEDKKSFEAKTLKVPADRLDALIDRVGELVIASAGTHAQALRLEKSELLESASLLLSLVEDIRDMALKLRMVPIGEVFSRFPRVVRDVSKEMGKEIELRISGADAELDKSMVEKIADPLMHLVRNAIDHGIESAEIRRQRGKPELGTVQLNAYHESGSIVVEVVDDGGGLDVDRILRKAIEKGLVPEGANLPEDEIFRLILEPGFSTAEQVTNLSGRGVGMDVVRNNVEALRGSLDISSKAGCSTTMRLCLPLTLAIIDGFHVGVGNSHFIVPLDMVLECLELPQNLDQISYIESRGEALPFVRLREVFTVTGPAHPRPRIVVVRFNGRRAGLVVDRIYGKCQTVIKPLGPLFEHVACISGSTILGDGEVGMIVDVPQLTQQLVAGGAWANRQTGRARATGSAPAMALNP